MFIFFLTGNVITAYWRDLNYPETKICIKENDSKLIVEKKTWTYIKM